MLSRRRFLQVNAAALSLPAVKSRTPAQSASGNDSASGSGVTRDYWNDWPAYLTTRMNEARARRKAALSSLATPSDVQGRARMIYTRVWELIGGPLKKTPLNPVTVGSIVRDAYRVEKVIFESQPQVYVTANLYVPTAGKPPFPGILAPLGHTENGKAYRNYQYVFQTLARKGYMVLAFDPFGQGERQQYLDPGTGRSRYGPTGEHSQAGRPLLLLGATFAQYRAWDGVRALDYLLGRPEIDPERIGCTGHSGGGTMTMYLCALEPRIRVAVEVEGNSENLAGPHYAPPGAVADAEQDLVGSLPEGLDRGDLLLAFAPKPLLLCYTPQDSGTTYSPVYEEATKEIFGELQHAYQIMGAPEKAGLFASPLPHDFDALTRQATYGWFNHWLGKEEAGTSEADFDPSEPRALNCTSTGQVLTSLGGRSLLQLNTDRARAVISARSLRQSSTGPITIREEVRDKLRRLLMLPDAPGPLQARVLSSFERKGTSIDEFEFQPEPQIRIPGWFMRPSIRREPLPTVIYLPEKGKDELVEEPSRAAALVREGYAVSSIDLRGRGLTTPHSPAAGPLFYDGDRVEDGYAWASLALGKPVAGQRVWDLLRCLDYLETREDVDRSRLYVVAESAICLAALMAAVLDDRLRAVLLIRPYSDLRSVLESERYSLPLAWITFGLLQSFDLPELVAALAPRRCWVLNAEGADGEKLPESDLNSRYEIAMEAYSRSDAKSQVRFLVQPDEEWTHLLKDWLHTS